MTIGVDSEGSRTANEESVLRRRAESLSWSDPSRTLFKEGHANVEELSAETDWLLAEALLNIRFRPLDFLLREPPLFSVRIGKRTR